ncbi:hypothetical protein Tco_0887458 [Tanacetum coccineum]
MCQSSPTTSIRPYGMFLTRLYRHVMEMYPHLDNVTYDIVERQVTSSHQHDNDDDVETSRASTPSPTISR